MIDVVCGLIQDTKRRFLACLRPQGKHLGGKWEFPGGKIDPGETPQAALARELLEELGVVVEVGGSLEPVEWTYERGAIRLHPFFCRIVSGEISAIEHEELRWCAPSEFSGLDWADADLPILNQIRGILAETSN